MFKEIIPKYKYQLVLFAITAVLFFINYSPGTYLSGWDNLQTELNPGLGVKRAFFSVWEEYQSFGLTAGMAHATDLVRAVFIWFVSFVIPQNVVRYFYHFLMLFLGGLGALKLFSRDPDFHRDGNQEKWPAFLGALFYMLNLGTVQIFYLPFESFSSFFAFLPWGVWSFKKILRHNSKLSKKNLLLLTLLNLLGTPAFYTQQLFFVYILVLGCFSLPYLIKNQNSIAKSLKKLISIFLLIFVINSFWILPQIYFLKTNGDWITQAKANQLATEDTLYQNLSKGTIDNFIKLEGFYFDLKGISNTYLFAPWKDHFNGIAGVLSYFFTGLGLLGILSVIINKVKDLSEARNNPNEQQNSQNQSLIPLGMILVLLLCALALLSVTPPFSWLNQLIRQSTLINQIFRSPFTKFIVPFSFVFSYFVAKGIELISKKYSYRYLIFGALIVAYSLPAFKGYFISPEMKVKIPSDYYQVMDYFKKVDKNKRITLLPDYTFWGWFFTKWGYNGSGFLWYGIEQPIVSRTFDVWSPKSEGYYWEQKRALESRNTTGYSQVLEKYGIDYLILDYSLIPAASGYKSFDTDTIEQILNQSNNISLVLKNNNLSVYKVNHKKIIKNFISVADNVNSVGPEVKLTPEDRSYQENGDYFSAEPYDIYYPFEDLTSQTRINDKKWAIEENIDTFSTKVELNINANEFRHYIPNSSEASLISDGRLRDIELNLNPKLEGNKLSVDFNKALLDSFDLSGYDKHTKEFFINADKLPQRYGYLIKIKSKNLKGSPLFFYVVDNTKKQSVIEESLRRPTEYFILPNNYDYGLGYTFGFQNKSYDNYPSENVLSEVSIYLFPYRELKDIKFIKDAYDPSPASYVNDFTAAKLNYYTYKVKINSGQTAILNQAYSPGWIAFSNGKILPHVLVNNWANGWIIDSQADTNHQQLVTIIFWPQYLEFLGFALLIIVFLFILKKE
ncbi:hypothetical protein B6D29_01035 [Microgenomates bacterium UTCPR1]|nr:MAG: hypothetical protein B6D29_01035 [Microgenomates bacterium UTCPR1]